MAQANPPYLSAYGTITRALEALKKASTPEKFSQDFVATKLGLKGGSGKQVIPYLKRIGFLGSDGIPTELYEQFRNDAQSGAAAAQALRNGYRVLYEVNEYVHVASDDDIMGVIIQATGAESDSKTAKAILGSFKALKAFADFDAPEIDTTVRDEEVMGVAASDGDSVTGSLRIGYTINLNLPATSDVAVFNAIFKSLREHLLR
ncbi:MAG: hypothetical protein F4Z34_08010 [Acidimicrobiaceae bacterium]|nr:hypothetical protein [Acidimicrobiaceae bacterium]